MSKRDPRNRTHKDGAPKTGLRLAKLDSEGWLDDEDPLTVRENALLRARLAAYAKEPYAGSTWEEVEGRIRARLSPGRTDEPESRR